MRVAHYSTRIEMERAMNSKVNAELEPKRAEPAPHEFPQTVFTDVDFITAHTVFAQFFSTSPERKPTPEAKGKMPNRWLGRIFASD